jgi:hypothetical protein
VLTFLGGVAIASGAVYTARTFALTRRGQATDRFTRAVDQLGSDKLEVCLGGIYALDRVARDSPDEHAPIMELLAAYVRAHSSTQPPPRQEVIRQAVIGVLNRRRIAYDKHDDMQLDLADSDLSGIQTQDLRLRRARLAGAKLQRATLIGADLRRANLIGARLQGAFLLNARLNHARLQSARLEDANLQGADLRRANMTGAHLENARYDRRTRWPKGFDAEAAGAINTDLDAKAASTPHPNGTALYWSDYLGDDARVLYAAAAAVERDHGPGYPMKAVAEKMGENYESAEAIRQSTQDAGRRWFRNTGVAAPIDLIVTGYEWDHDQGASRPVYQLPDGAAAEIASFS